MTDEIHVGAYVLKVGAPEGALVTPAPPALRPALLPRPDGARILPPPLLTFIDRDVEVEQARAEIAAGRSIESVLVVRDGAGDLAREVQLTGIGE